MKRANDYILFDSETALSHFGFDFEFDNGSEFDEKIIDFFESDLCNGSAVNGLAIEEKKSFGNPINYSKNFKIYEGDLVNRSTGECWKGLGLKSYETWVAFFDFELGIFVSIKNLSRTTNNHIRLFCNHIRGSIESFIEFNIADKFPYHMDWYEMKMYRKGGWF